MFELLHIPEGCIINKPIPLGKVFQSDGLDDLEECIWYASMKPGICHVQAFVSSRERYEEIQFIRLRMRDSENLFDPVRALCRTVKYPCVILIDEGGIRFRLCAAPFVVGKTDFNRNIIYIPSFTCSFHPDRLSMKAQSMIDRINLAIEGIASLKELYYEIYHAVQTVPMGGITKAHCARLIKDMLGPTSEAKQARILQDCKPYRVHAPINDSKAARYDKNARMSNYRYAYDYEELWYCFMKDDAIRKVIEHRRYRDIEDLIYSIDSRLEEQRDRW